MNIAMQRNVLLPKLHQFNSLNEQLQSEDTYIQQNIATQRNSSNNTLQDKNTIRKLIYHHKRHQSVQPHNKLTSNKSSTSCQRSPQYSHQQVQQCLKPINCLSIDTKDQYISENTRQFKTLTDGKKHEQDLRNKAELRDTRRILEVYSPEILNKAIDVIDNKKNMREKIQKYIDQKDKSFAYQNALDLSGNNVSRNLQIGSSMYPFISHVKNKSVISKTTTFGGVNPEEFTTLNQSLIETSNLQIKNQNSQATIATTDSNSTQLKSNYQMNFYNKSSLGKTINYTVQDITSDNNDPQLPTIQAARLALMKQLKQLNGDNQSQRNSSQNYSLKYATEIINSQVNQDNQNQEPPQKSENKKSKFLIQNTLHGMQSNIGTQDMDTDLQYWGGIKVRNAQGGTFSKRRDKTTDWINNYYNGGLFKYIQ